MRILLPVLFIVLCHPAIAGKVSGIITDNRNQPLAFSSIIVKGTAQGTSANSSGQYSLLLTPGEYTLVCQHVGYRSLEKKITVASKEVELNFEMAEQQYELGTVTVKNGEDPAYAIMRNAIKKRSYHEKEIKKFQAEVYIKGQFKLRDYPNRFFGQKVDFEDGDTGKLKMVFLSETVARYSVDEPKSKIEVLSTRVSGDKDALGFSSPQIFSFYANNIALGPLNPRGFISPVSINALNYYTYKFEGTFFENDKMINRIRVTPRRKYEPLFNGYINIMENEWRIHSLQLTLFKENQMQLADTLLIEQLYVPLGGVWVIKQQTIYPSVKVLGFDAYGSFVQVFDKFDLNPVFAKNFFNNTILKVYDSANNRQSAYWDTIRPVPLLAEELTDYRQKDSLEQVKKDPKYLDSLDRVRNKINPVSLLLTGQTFGNAKKREVIEVDPLLDVVSYNTVEGWVVNLSPTYSKRLNEKGRKSVSITPNLRYGFSRKRFNAHLTGTYNFGGRYLSSLTLSGGRRMFQIDNANQITPRNNTFSTLLWEKNLIKLYEAVFIRASYTQAVGDGFTITGAFQYQDRKGLQDISFTKWSDKAERDFRPNIYIPDHQSSMATINIRWQPGAKYIELPDTKFSIGSKYPTLNLSVTHGIKGFLKSDVDYTKWKFTIDDNLNLKLAGRLGYRFETGGFLRRDVVFMPDYTHYFGNETNAILHNLNSFNLMQFYVYSNVEKIYGAAHVEYHLNGFITNKIPLFKKLNWFIVAGNNSLYLANKTWYTEVSVGLENIFKTLRVDFLKSYTNNGIALSGIRFSLPAVLRAESE